MPGENSSNVIETTYINLNTHTGYESDNAGGIQFAQSTPGDTEIDKTIPIVCHNKVHRGRVCCDLIDFFYVRTMIRQCLKTISFKKWDTRSLVMQDACLTEFSDTILYLRYTEENAWSPDA